jgi:DNA-binding transcriptional LysR family regulator
MELRHLRYFIAVAEEENVTRAAVRLHVAQPSLSRQIRDLEADLGLALFEHGARSLRLTDAGRQFLAEARAVLARLEEGVRSTRAVVDGEGGEIRIGYAPSLAVELLPRILRQFQRERPRVRVQLHDLSTMEMLRGLRDGSLHLALLVRMRGMEIGDLHFEEIERHAVCVALHPSHPLARLSQLRLEQLAGERIIAFNVENYPEYHRWLAHLFSGLAKPPRIVEEHDSATSLIAAVEAGRGVAMVSQRIDCLSGQRLKVLPLWPAPLPLVIGIASPRQGAASVASAFQAAALAMQDRDG